MTERSEGCTQILLDWNVKFSRHDEFNALWGMSARTKNSQEDQFIPVVITKQLEAKNGLIPADLRCGTARLSAPQSVGRVPVRLEEQYAANITAADTIYTVVYEQDGSLYRDSFSSVAKAFVHKDFKETNKLIGPGNETSF